MNDFPRVLILCDEPINRIGGGGVTMGNLFRGWPQDRLAQIWAHHRFEIDTDVCPLNLRLGDHSVPDTGRLGANIRRRRGLVKRLRVFIRPGLRLDYQRVLKWARGFNPEVIYSQATPYPMYTWWLPRWLAGDLNIPLVNHVMDDWPFGIQQEWLPIITYPIKLMLKWQLEALFKTASFNLAISQQMAGVYRERYGYSFIPFHNAIDLDEWATPKVDYAIKAPIFRVVYLGALAENMQVQSLRNVAQVVSSLANRGVAINLTIHTGDIYRDYFEQYLGDLSAINHGGAIARHDLCATLAAADLLVIPVNFDHRSLALNQYSMPTKVPEYMASGAPILINAPSHAPPAAYATSHGWGYLVDQPNLYQIEKAVVTLMESVVLRRQLGQTARSLAVRLHDARLVRKQFRQVIEAAKNRYFVVNEATTKRIYSHHN